MTTPSDSPPPISIGDLKPPKPTKLGKSRNILQPPVQPPPVLNLQPLVEAPVDNRPSKVRLKSFADKIALRMKDIQEIFSDADYSPLKNRDFKKFLSDQVAEIAMRYVRVGVVSSEDADAEMPADLDTKMKQRGFTVGSAGVAKAEDVKTESSDSTTTTTLPDHADDAWFQNSPAMRGALASGFDPNEES